MLLFSRLVSTGLGWTCRPRPQGCTPSAVGSTTPPWLGKWERHLDRLVGKKGMRDGAGEKKGNASVVSPSCLALYFCRVWLLLCGGDASFSFCGLVFHLGGMPHCLGGDGLHETRLRQPLSMKRREKVEAVAVVEFRVFCEGWLVDFT